MLSPARRRQCGSSPRPNWQSPSSTRRLCVARPTSLNPAQETPWSGVMKRHSRPRSSAWPASMADMSYRRITPCSGPKVGRERPSGQRIWRRDGLKVPRSNRGAGCGSTTDSEHPSAAGRWPTDRLAPMTSSWIELIADGRKFRKDAPVSMSSPGGAGRCRRAKIELGQCRSPLSADRALRPTRPAGSYPFRQRLRVYRDAVRDWLGRIGVKTLYNEPGTLGERIQRELQLKAPAEIAGHGDLLYLKARPKCRSNDGAITIWTRFSWTQNWLNRSVQGGPDHDRQY